MSDAPPTTTTTTTTTTPTTNATASEATHAPGHHEGLGALALGALGVVFGDIGTSPLYALKECVSRDHGVAPTAANVYGLLSLIFWALTMVVTVKYLTFVMRADNDGEGGILALLALLPEKLRVGKKAGSVGLVAAMVLFGAALLYGDGIITPAISVLSAIEGLEVATPAVHKFTVPITCVILLALFIIQRRGTAGIGRIFGPIMIVWFAAIGILGGIYIARDPVILKALSPHYAVEFCFRHKGWSFVVLGSVVLAITGGEALYADMGHFGRKPIRLAWFFVVMPCLVLNYFGQGALLLQNPTAAGNPFFAMVPKGGLTYVLVALSAAATVIASQALISGAFSLTRQATQLGYLPRITVRHTSSATEGQIYVPAVNWLLAVACIALVLGFKESSRLAAAYGIAVTGTMAITSIVYYVVVREDWKWPRWKALPLLILFLCWDLPFFASNMLKFPDGGYVPIIVAVIIFDCMMIWRRGRVLLINALTSGAPPMREFIAKLGTVVKARTPGTAVFLTSQPRGMPAALVHFVNHTHALHERVILLTLAIDRKPRVPIGENTTVEEFRDGFTRVVIHSGFMENHDVPARLTAACQSAGLGLDMSDTTFFLGRETFLATSAGEMARLPETVFSFLYKNAGSATGYFGLPAANVVELGMQIDL
jgi:KUP system potassium uptake protein